MNTVLMSGDSIGVVGRVGIFSSLARELVGKLSCQILFVDFSSSLKFENLANLTSCSILTVPVIEFKTLILLYLLS